MQLQARAPAAYSANLAIQAKAQAAEWQEALQLLGPETDLVGGNTVISAASKAQHWPGAMAVLRWMPSAGLEPNLISQGLGIAAASRHWDRAMALLRWPSNAICVGSTMAACRKGLAWHQSLQLWDLLAQQGVRRDLGCLRGMVAAQPKWRLLVEDEQCCDVALAALRRENSWSQSVALMEGMGWKSRLCGHAWLDWPPPEQRR